MTTLSPLLHSLAEASSPRLILALRPQDIVPDWINYVIHLGDKFQILYHGQKDRLRPKTEREEKKVRVSNSTSLSPFMVP